jgi:pyruvate,water dikinase
MSNLGAKADNLLRLKNEFGLNVPEFEAVPFERLIQDFSEVKASLEDTVNAFLTGKKNLPVTSSLLKSALASVTVKDDASSEIANRLRASGYRKVSFRTSAELEDGAVDSYAGQYQSFLDIDISAKSLSEYAIKCFTSLVGDTVINYSKQRGVRSFEIGGSVVIQQMFYGKASGVLFTENGSGKLQIAFNKSWQNTVVEGEDAEELIVDRINIDNEKLTTEIRSLCLAALAVEARIGRPLDIEWAYDSISVAFLQFRPITKPMLDYRFEWDSTNISENYPGITLPLTYSVIRQFYSGVYLSFFKMLGAKKSEIDAKTWIADNMLGYLDGRVYYRISNWYEAIKLVPGKRNQEYFEAMLNPVKKRGEAIKSRMDIRSAFALARFVGLVLSSERRSREFSKLIIRKIAFYDAINFDYINANTILESGKQIRKEVLNDWSTTILNDVRLMLFHGILQRLYSKNENPQDYLKLIQGLQDKASIKPLEALTKLGVTVTNALDLEQVSTLGELRKSASWAAVKQAADEYIGAYGARTPGELKLESERLTDQLDTVLSLALRASESGVSSAPVQTARTIVWPSGSSLLLRPFIRWVGRNTRSAIDWRERFRFNRAQTFNLSRKAFDSVGAALTSENLIDSPRDIYWLTDSEIDELVGAHAPLLEVKSIITARKKAFAKFEKQDKALAVHGSGKIAAMHQVDVVSASGRGDLEGNGVASGEITAEAIVLKEFDATADVRGKVLVVSYIDPGWTLLFTQAAGIIAERGNALSHAAIIAREIGIPCIVAIPNATQTLRTGQRITMNGNSGVITIEPL